MKQQNLLYYNKMNAEELQEVLLSSPPILVKAVKEVDLGLPKWSDLEK